MPDERVITAEVYVRRLVSKEEETRAVAPAFGVDADRVYQTDVDTGVFLLPDISAVSLDYVDNRPRGDRYPFWLEIFVCDAKVGWDVTRLGALAQLLDSEGLAMFGKPRQFVVGIPNGMMVDVGWCGTSIWLGGWC